MCKFTFAFLVSFFGSVGDSQDNRITNIKNKIVFIKTPTFALTSYCNPYKLNAHNYTKFARILYNTDHIRVFLPFELSDDEMPDMNNFAASLGLLLSFT